MTIRQTPCPKRINALAAALLFSTLSLGSVPAHAGQDAQDAVVATAAPTVATALPEATETTATTLPDGLSAPSAPTPQPLPATAAPDTREAATKVAIIPQPFTETPGLLTARDTLRSFAGRHLRTMAANLCFTATKHCVEQKDGRWVASYKDIAHDTLVVQVKPVQGKANRYIGLIRYAVLNFEASADSKIALLDQEFRLVKRLWQTEILRYDGKNWK